MKEEIAATWFATSLITCVVGAQFSARAEISPTTRCTIEALFLFLALFICFWTTISHFNLISYQYHRFGLKFILLATMASLIYLIALAFERLV